jgi:SAM-dependent methyltransferase
MERKDKELAIRRYTDRLDKLGTTVQALGWKDREQQYLRFEILADIGELDGKSVLDVGCGFGDLLGYLTEAGKRVEYTGIDINPDIVSEARKRYPGVRFECQDLTEQRVDGHFDYVIESGVFNHKLSDNERFMRDMLSAMFDHCVSAVAANMMTSYVDYRDDHLFYYDPGEALGFAKELSRFTSIRHDYPLYEFTLFVYKLDRFSN